MLAGPQGGRMPRAGRARPGGKRTPKRGREMRRVPKLVLSALVALSVALGVAPATALADGETCTEQNCDHVAAIGSTHYDTLKDAIDDVQSGQTITLLRDVSDATGMAVGSGKNFTLDFNNTTYTLVGPGAGSGNVQFLAHFDSGIASR